MSVSSVGSSFSTATLATLLGTTSPSSTGTSTSASAASSASQAVSVDISAVAKAATAGDSTAKAAAMKQLKADLVSEQSALLSGLLSGGSATEATDPTHQLLSALYGQSSSSKLTQSNVTGSTLNTTA